jgi:hypothetical protein
MEFNYTRKGFRGAGILALALLFVSGVALGQAQTGNVYAKASDEQGAGLPGVAVTLSGIGAPLTQVTNVNGDARFLNLAPSSTVTLDFALQGFGKVSRKNVVVAVGQNTEIYVTMKLSGVAAEVVVTGESPLLDTRRTATGANISQTELSSIPTARDPWVVLASVPGVQVDRINVGGNESGQQSLYVTKGSSTNNGTWNVDGVNITDVGAVGSTPTYYDFDSFQEMQVSTGGADVTLLTAGANLNMVTKRGTNDVHGSARVFATDNRWQSGLQNDEARSQGFVGGNKIDSIQDYGLEVGGPIVKDRLWLWGSYGRDQVNLRTPGTAALPAGTSDKTTLEDINAKLNAQVIDNNSATLFFLRGDKIKIGRNAAPTRPHETTWDQSGPTSLYKLEDSHIFSPNLFATALWSSVSGGFGLISEGRPFIGTTPNYAYRSADGVNHNAYEDYITDRPQHQFSANLNAFARTGDVGHEFKFGFSYRTTPVTSSTTWPHGIRMIESTNPERFRVRVYRTSAIDYTTKFYSGYLSDTLTIKNLTVNLGVRYDNQSGNNQASTSAANESFPDIIPAISNTDTSTVFHWKNFSPRIGLTYALGKDTDKTLIRATYGRFVDNLGGGQLFFNSNTQYGYIWYRWHDLNHDHIAQRSEINFNQIDYAYNINPSCTSCPNPNRINPDLKSPTTDEVTLGLEREVIPGLAVSLTGTYRKLKDFAWTPRYGLNADGSMHVYTAADFEQVDTLHLTDTQGRAVNVPVYDLKASAPAFVGKYLTNRSDYSQEYKGVELAINKRYSNRWAMRAAFTWNDWTQSVGQGGIEDPTQALNNLVQSFTWGASTANGPVVYSAGTGSGSKANVWINSHWNLNVSGMYTLPLDFNVAGNLFMRQGYPTLQTDANDYCNSVGCPTLLLQPIGSDRLNTVTELDLRLSKEIKVSPLSITLSIDVFNVLNRQIVMQRQSDTSLNVHTGGDIQETQSPRVVRFGARIAF